MIDTIAPQSGPRSCGEFIEQHEDELSKGISTAQHMSCEMLRMNSFKHRPYDSYKGVWPSQLAKAGFYYDPRSQATICFVCGFRKPASFWLKGRNPLQQHRIESPNCRYITGHCEENVPFHTQEQRNNKLSYLEPNSSSNRPAALSQGTGYQGRLIADGIPATGPPSNQVTAPTVTQESNSFSIEPRPRNRLTPPQNQRSGSEVVHSLPIGGTSSSLAANPQGQHQQGSEPPFQSLPVTVNQNHISLDAPPEARTAPSVVADHPNEVANSIRGNTGVNNTTSAPASLPYFQSGGSSTGAPVSLQYQSMSTSQTSRPTINRSTGQPELFDGDGPQPLQRMKTEEARLMTYTRWPNHAAVTPQDLARAGFFYTGSNDRVQCAFCENVLRNWERGDNPTFEHRRHFPRCRFVLGEDVGNVPIPPAQRQRAQANLQARSPGMLPSAVNRQQPQVAYQQPQAPAPAPQQIQQPRTPGTSALSAYGINTDRPKHPEYAAEASRMLTFRTWTTDRKQPADVLCRAGFFYTGQGDNVRCFHCDGGLRNWERQDDPFTEHARWFPRCNFIRDLRGEAFVNAQAQRFPRVQHLPNEPAQAPTARPQQMGGGGSTGSSGYHTAPSATTSNNPRPTHMPGVQHRVEEREVKARMDTPAVRAVLDMGFDRNVVLNAIRKQLSNRGQDFSSAEMLLEALFEEEDAQMLDEEEEMESSEEQTPTPPAQRQNHSEPAASPARMLPGGGQPAAPPQNTTGSAPVPSANPSASAAPTATTTRANSGANNASNTEGATGGNNEVSSSAGGSASTGKIRRKRKNKKPATKQGENNAPTPPAVENPEDSGIVSSSGSKSSQGAATSTETKTLLEENRQLKDQRMCKVCMDAEANIVFLPCGHLVCCANCAPALRNCAVCRSLIRGTVRTYLS